MKTRYRKIGPRDPGYVLIHAAQLAGRKVCDAYTHNSPRGCSNPDCWKYRSRDRVRK